MIRTTALVRPRLAPARSGQLLFWANTVLVVGLLVALFLVRSDTQAMRLNQVASETIVAERQVAFLDRAATAARRQHAIDATQPAYQFNPGAAAQHTSMVITFLAEVGRVLASSASVTDKQAAIVHLIPAGIKTTALGQFPILSRDEFKVVQEYSRSLMEQAEAWRFSSSELQATELGLLSTVAPRISRDQRIAISSVLVSFLTPTLSLDESATRRLQQQAAARLKPVKVTIYQGEVVVRRGDVVIPSVLEKLTALGIQGHHISWKNLLGSILFAVAIMAMLFWYLHAFHSDVLTTPRLLLLVDGCILITALAARLLTGGHILLPFFLPIAAASTFAAVLTAPEACIAITFAMAILAGWIVANSFELTVYYLLSGAAGVLAIRQVRQVKQFIMAGLYITLFALATILAFGFFDRSYDLAAFQEHVIAAAFNGFLSSTLALGGFALLSSFFGVTTTLQLLELVQPSQPLLRRLMVKAPGTYNHSLIVASMVERASEEIGANTLVAKVGALYHDVGKTANPHCFVENQLGISNIHDELRSDESARIIRGHVSQGLRLARQHKLPRLLVDAIAEHHGTMQLAYFLHKAQQETDSVPIDRSLYSYPGPKPQTKETALLMLADGCESAVRASNDHSNDRIRDIVASIFRERVQQGQLDECPLTLRDVHAVQEAFRAVLVSLYHPRIEYPDLTDHSLDMRPVLEHGRST